MPANPNTSRITPALWRLWEEFDRHYPAVRLGGIYDPKPGYHSSRQENRSSDYSVRYAADKRGPSDKASALDLTFPDAQAGNPATIARYTKRLDVAARARDPRLYIAGTPVLREFIGTFNGRTTYAYDLQSRRSDSNRHPSHLWHIHLSVTRAFADDWSALAGVLSVLKGDSTVALTKADVKVITEYDPGDDTGVSNWGWRKDFKTNPTVQLRFAWWLAPEEAHGARIAAEAARADVAELADVVEELTDRVNTLPTTLAPLLVTAVGEAVAGQLPADVLATAVEGAVRKVLGSLDGDQVATLTTPQ